MSDDLNKFHNLFCDILINFKWNQYTHFVYMTKETNVLNSNFGRCCRHWETKTAPNCFQKIKNKIQINFKINITNLVWVSCSILRQFVWQQFFFCFFSKKIVQFSSQFVRWWNHWLKPSGTCHVCVAEIN